MTNRTREKSLEKRTPDDAQPLPDGQEAGRPVRSASLIGGAALMLMAALAGFGNVVVVDGLVTSGDAARTAGDIMASEGVFRLGVATLYLVVVLDVVVAWALLRVFAPVSTDLSRLAAWFRLAYAGVLTVAVSQLAGVPGLLNDDGYTAAFGTEQLQALALQKTDAYNDIWMAGLILFGVHLMILGYLAYKSGYVPRFLGVLLVIAGVGYAFDSFVTVFSQGSPFAISQITFLGEFLLGLWLLFRGRHLSSRTVSHGL
jgi:hypothetical protein